jgi:hypothetical protein
MPKYIANVRYGVQGYQSDTLEIEASSQEEAEQKALNYMKNISDEGVEEVEGESYYDDIRHVNLHNPLWEVPYDITVNKKETKDV